MQKILATNIKRSKKAKEITKKIVVITKLMIIKVIKKSKSVVLNYQKPKN